MPMTEKGVSSRSAVLTLPTDTQIKITREFDAPAHLIYKAYTTPELIKRWWHAKRGGVTVAEVDLRVGGKWRWAMETEQGLEVAFHGEYKELVENEKIVSTEIYEGVPNEEAHSLNTLVLDEKDGRTTMTLVIEAFTKEGRDAIIASGMEDGLQDALDLLEETAISLA